MRFDAAQTFAGVPIQRVRDLLRGSALHPFTATDWAERFNMPASQARRLCRALAEAGFIEPAPKQRNAWQLSVLGSSLGAAQFTAPYRRATADRALGELVERARSLEGDDHPFAYRVAELRVFGSYLQPEADRVGDLDILYRLIERFTDVAEQERCEAQRRQMVRSFRNITDEVFWPQTEVVMFLRQRRAIYQLMDARGMSDFANRVESRLVYSLGAPAVSP